MLKKCPRCNTLNVDNSLACGECGTSLESVKAEVVVTKKPYVVWPTWWGLGERVRLSKPQYIILMVAMWVFIGLLAVVIGSGSSLWATVLLVTWAIICTFWWIVGRVAAMDASNEASRRPD